MAKFDYAIHLVVKYVTKNPGCTKYAAGKAAWEYSYGIAPASNAYLYGPVDRAIAAGLIRAEKIGGKYSLTIQDADTGAD